MLRLTTAAARQITADFLGVDEEEVSDRQTSEVVRELTNMICGSVLSRLESSTAFQLAAPEIVPAGEEEDPAFSNIQLAMGLANGKLNVSVAIDTA